MFLSAFLLFSLEPLVAKTILPWFGGSAAVWSTCLVFYQTALLAGYFYASLLTRYLPASAQAFVHVALLTGALAWLPIGPGQHWRPAPLDHPQRLILAMLTISIGLPFIALSATTPLLQNWLARAGYRTPYRFFALSNFASLAALLAYPLLIEPQLDTRTQSLSWSAIYIVFTLLCGFAAWRSRRISRICAAVAGMERLPAFRTVSWFALGACGSMLLLAVTNHIDQNIAAVPLLWVLPLIVYLLTFIIAFGMPAFYKRGIWLRILAFALAMLGYAIYNIDVIHAIQVSIPVFLAGLFACCMFCHGELNRLRPETSRLTTFYLVIAAGAAAGAILVTLIAPRIFDGIYELPLTLFITAALAIATTWTEGQWPVRLLWIAMSAAMAVVFANNVHDYRADTLSLRRSFYGALQVVQSRPGPRQHRTLYHGTIEHGTEFLLPPLRSRPTSYYGPDSGIGIVLRECFPSPKRVGIVGLGVGTIAAYGERGDTFRFYDINPQVIDIARSLFFYLGETRARVEIVEGDARLALERDTSPAFDVLALDAFSGDAIPVHLLTEEALALYIEHLKPNGAIAFHVSNNFLDLAPVVRQLANRAGYQAVLLTNDESDDELILHSDWVLVTNNRDVLDNPGVQAHVEDIESRTGLRPWTDRYSSLLQVLTPPSWKSQ